MEPVIIEATLCRSPQNDEHSPSRKQHAQSRTRTTDLAIKRPKL